MYSTSMVDFTPSREEGSGAIQLQQQEPGDHVLNAHWTSPTDQTCIVAHWILVKSAAFFVQFEVE